MGGIEKGVGIQRGQQYTKIKVIQGRKESERPAERHDRTKVSLKIKKKRTPSVGTVTLPEDVDTVYMHKFSRLSYPRAGVVLTQPLQVSASGSGSCTPEPPTSSQEQLEQSSTVTCFYA